MSILPFHAYFPELAEDECRHVFLEGEPGPHQSQLPAGGYALMEYYCTDRKCDCRRVILAVIDHRTGKKQASISFGFDRDDPLRGPFLDPMNYQCSYADELLELVRDVVLRDPQYVARLERHYSMVKQAAGAKAGVAAVSLSPQQVQERIAQRKAMRRLLEKKQSSRKRPR